VEHAEHVGARRSGRVLVQRPGARAHIRDTFPARQDTDEELLTWMRTHGLLADYVLDDPDLLEMAVEIMRADIAVRDTFRYNGAAGVTMPLQFLAGADDEGDRSGRTRPVARVGVGAVPARFPARWPLLHT
jgi:surfactin synthase thioesterase subunit